MSELKCKSPLSKARMAREAVGPRPLAAVAAAVDQETARRLLRPSIEGRRRALLAVSGGPDSVALMRLCAAIAREGASCDIEVATVDHGLRADSRVEAERVGAWAKDCGFTHSILSWEGPKPASRIQETARQARYALLGAKAREISADMLITAHTIDDQAETVLMRIARGSGLAGLAGMRPISERGGLAHARPFLGVAKARLVATCHANAWPFIEDPSNADPRFARSRWRKLAPALAREGLTSARLAMLAERAAAAEAALEIKADEAFAVARLDGGADRLILDMALLLRREPQAIALRALLRALTELHGAERLVPIRLERVERSFEALRICLAAHRAFKHTVAGAVLACDAVGRLSLVREGPRRRGRAATSGPKPADTVEAQTAAGANKGNSNALLALV